MWNLSFLIRGQTHTPCIGRQSLNHWTAREVPQICIFKHHVMDQTSVSLQTSPDVALTLHVMALGGEAFGK